MIDTKHQAHYQKTELNPAPYLILRCLQIYSQQVSFENENGCIEPYSRIGDGSVAFQHTES